MSFPATASAILAGLFLVSLVGCSPQPPAQPTNTSSPATAKTPTSAPTKAATNAPMTDEEDYELADGTPGFEECKTIELVASTPESIEKGKALYSANCTTCHGESGKGDGPAGNALDPPPRDLTVAPGYKYGSKSRAVYRTTFYGIEDTGMAGFGESLNGAEEVWQVVHYVQSLQK